MMLLTYNQAHKQLQIGGNALFTYLMPKIHNVYQIRTVGGRCVCVLWGRHKRPSAPAGHAPGCDVSLTEKKLKMSAALDSSPYTYVYVYYMYVLGITSIPGTEQVCHLERLISIVIIMTK